MTTFVGALLEELPTLSDLSIGTLLGLTIVLLLTGRLVPRNSLLDKAEEAERWRVAYEASRKSAELSDRQTTELLELAKTTYSLLQAILHNREQVGEPDG